ncbi:MAG: alpha/beta hydrolase [Nitrospinota bacterium]|nr:MAG: alpha/beta hydrolase [Nitrospinota bacterium]
MRYKVFLSIGFILFLASWLPAGAVVIDLETRPGVQQRFLLLTPDHPLASVLLLVGGHGRLGMQRDGSLNWGKKNFLVRNRTRFVEQGLVVALLDAPSDRQDGRGLLGGFRAGAAHARDVGAVVAYLRRRFALPVWLIGTSRGSISAANAAIRLQEGGPDGLVLTASVTRPNRKGSALLSLDLSRITIPTLVIHHTRDGCFVSPYRDTATLLSRLVNAPRVELIPLHGGAHPQSHPCRAQSYHGFWGLDLPVVTTIAEWIRVHTPGAGGSSLFCAEEEKRCHE